MIVVAYGKWSIASHLHVEIKHPGYNEVVSFRLFFYENDWRKVSVRVSFLTVGSKFIPEMILVVRNGATSSLWE